MKFTAREIGVVEATNGSEVYTMKADISAWKSAIFKEDGSKNSTGNVVERLNNVVGLNEPDPTQYNLTQTRQFKADKKAAAAKKAALKSALTECAKEAYVGSIIDFCAELYSLAEAGAGELEFTPEAKAAAIAEREATVAAEKEAKKKQKEEAAAKKAAEKEEKKRQKAEAAATKATTKKVETSAEVVSVDDGVVPPENVNPAVIFPAQLLKELGGDTAKYEAERGALMTAEETAVIENGLGFDDNMFIDLSNVVWMKDDLKDPSKISSINITYSDKVKILTRMATHAA